jgi:hypothetical protein
MRVTTALLAVALPLAVPLAGCGDDDDASGGGGTGTVAVHLEETDAIFIEGFEVGLRFETAGGEVLDRRLWTQFVEGLGEESIDAFYDSVLEAEVPAGAVVVLAEVVLSIGGPIEPPDLDGDLACRLEVDVPDGGRVEVEVSFAGGPDCLSVTS